MILKFYSDEEWHYLDNISDFSIRYASCDILVQQFNQEVGTGKRAAFEEPKDSIEEARQLRSKIFLTGASYASKGIEPYEVVHVDAVMAKKINSETVCIITAIRNKTKYVIVATNDVYLLNDKGQTVEKLA